MEAEALMRLAIERARAGVAAGQSPFGCAIALGEEVIACEHNQVLASLDATAHAEIVALRTACARLRDVHLHGTIVATTCEPCPMCMAALHWARVHKVYFGASIADATAAGFNELHIPATEMVRQGRSGVSLTGGVLGAECAALFKEWRATGRARTY